MQKKYITDILNRLQVYPTDLVKLVRAKGFLVGISDTRTLLGYCLIDSSEKLTRHIIKQRCTKAIGVDQSLSGCERRYALAYMFGQYLLEYNDEPTWAAAYEPGYTDPDIQKLALNLMMPPCTFDRLYQKYKDKDLDENDILVLLAKKFNTNETYIKLRIKIGPYA